MVVLWASVGCKYDNYAPPSLTYSGRLTFQGDTFHYDGNPARGLFNLLQSGYGKVDPGIGMRVDQNGSFSQLLFKGHYGLTLDNYAYPFEFTDFKSRGAGLGYDTLSFDIAQNVSRNFEVTPYYKISDFQVAVDGINIVAKFKVTKVAGTVSEAPPIVNARIYLSTSSVVNSATPCVATAAVDNVSWDTELTVPISVVSYRNAYTNNFRDYAFARVSIELQGVSDYYLFSDIKKVDSVPTEFNDVTDQYMVNYKQEFEILKWFDDRRGVVKGWNADASVEPTMYDGWSDRRWMSAENWCSSSNTVVGGVWQTATLPAGNYIFLAKRGWNATDLNGGTNRAFLAVARGQDLHWNTSDLLGKSDLGLSENAKAVSVSFSLSEETTVSLGYIVDLPAGECNAISFTSFQIINTK
jgi:hypothetical protein